MEDVNLDNQNGSPYMTGNGSNVIELGAFLDSGLCVNRRCRFNLASGSKFVVSSDNAAFQCVLNVRYIDRDGKCALAEYEGEE